MQMLTEEPLPKDDLADSMKFALMVDHMFDNTQREMAELSEKDKLA